MNKLKDIMVYFLEYYVYKNEMSNARLCKMVYLADWKMCLENNHQITNIRWKFDSFGPYVKDVITLAKESDDFNIESQANLFGCPKRLISLSNKNIEISLSNKEKKILKFVINLTKDLYWDEFIDLIYSTYPIKSQEKYNYLNLIELSKEHRKNLGDNYIKLLGN